VRDDLDFVRVVCETRENAAEELVEVEFGEASVELVEATRVRKPVEWYGQSMKMNVPGCTSSRRRSCESRDHRRPCVSKDPSAPS